MDLVFLLCLVTAYLPERLSSGVVSMRVPLRLRVNVAIDSTYEKGLRLESRLSALADRTAPADSMRNPAVNRCQALTNYKCKHLLIQAFFTDCGGKC